MLTGEGFEPACWEEFWSKHPGTLAKLVMTAKYPDSATTVRAYLEFVRFWEEHAAKNNYTLIKTSDAALFDYGRINAEIEKAELPYDSKEGVAGETHFPVFPYKMSAKRSFDKVVDMGDFAMGIQFGFLAARTMALHADDKQAGLEEAGNSICNLWGHVKTVINTIGRMRYRHELDHDPLQDALQNAAEFLDMIKACMQ